MRTGEGPTDPMGGVDRRRPFLGRLLAQSGRADAQRAIAELLAGRPVRIADAAQGERVVLAVDSLVPGMLDELRAAARGPLTLALSRTRAAVLGADGTTPVSVVLGDGASEADVQDLAASASPRPAGAPSRAGRIDEAAIELAKLAHLLPAAVVADVSDVALLERLLRVSVADALGFRAGHGASLRRVSSAPVPLRAASDCELTVFRDELGHSWSMIRVGRPDPARPVPMRLHSACLTGDAFASLRCDCGDQLQMAIEAMAALGGGVLLYLAQEGCGLGLGNKMRAYRLQDDGLDTVDANLALGFEMDERRYDAAAAMLRAVGISRVAPLTNNPSKLAALRAAGLDVEERIPLLAPVRRGNRRYLETKRRRAGHLIGEGAPVSVG